MAFSSIWLTVLPARLEEHTPGGALCIFRVQGHVIGKGIDFPDIGIKNGINFHNFGIRNGTYYQDFDLKYKVGYTFRGGGVLCDRDTVTRWES